MATNTKSITSNTFISTDSSILLPKCSQSFLSHLCASVIDLDLSPSEAGGTVYITGFTNLLQDPAVRVRTVDPSTGVETLLFIGTDYTVNHVAGEITLVVATTDIVRVDFSYKPLSDTELDVLFDLSISEVGVLIRRPIDVDNIPVEYETAICLQFTMNVLKTLMIETRDFFSISVAGKSVSKTDIPKTFDLLIKTYHEQFMLLVRQLRQWNTSARLE